MTGRTKAEPRRRARAPLGVRVALVALAAACVFAAGIAAVNLYATNLFDEATQSLRENIAEASDETADLDTLHLRQQQTDARFHDAAALDMVLAPSLRSAIDANAEISATLTTRINRELDRQRNGDAQTAQQVEQGQASGDGTGGTGQGLTEEQRRQVEELLQANQSTVPYDESNGGTTTDEQGKGSDVKPW